MSDRTLFRRLYDAFVDKPLSPPREGEVAYADPFRLFPKAMFTEYNPDELITRKGYAVIDKMRVDDQIKACMAFKKLAVTATGWHIEAPPEQDEEWEPMLFVEDQFNHLAGTFQHSLYEILSALDYGFSVSEKVWGPIESGDWAGKLGLRAIKTRKPHFFGFRQDEFGNLKDLLQYDTQGSFGLGRPLPVGKFVIYSYMEEFDNPYGQSDLRAAYRWFWNKDMAAKWLMMMLERFGIPPLIGVYDPNELQGKQLEDLKTIFQRLQAATNMLIPGRSGPGEEGRSFDLEFPEVAGQVATVFKPALEQFDTAIARALLMPGLLGLSPDQTTGSLARSRTSFDMFMLVLEYLRAELEELVNEQIVYELVSFNFNVEDFPIFRLNEISDDVRTDLLEQWSKLVSTGVVANTDEDEDHIRSMMKFPERKDDDVEDDDLPPDDEPPEDEDDDAFKAFRQKTTFERRVNFTRIERYLQNQEQATVRSLAGLMGKAKMDMTARIRRRGVNLDTLRGLKEISSRAKLRKALQAYLTELFGRGRRDLRAELNLPRNLDQGDGPNFVPAEALRYLREKSLILASTVNDAAIGAVKQALQKSIELGETTQAATARLDEAFRPFIGIPGVTVDDEQLQPHRLENIVRTESTAAYNQGRIVEGRQKQIVDRMRGFQYSAILDSRTTPVCQSLDGKVFQIGDPQLDRLRPPNHHQCRSVLVPVTVFDEIDERDIVSPSESGRALELANKGFV